MRSTRIVPVAVGVTCVAVLGLAGCSNDDSASSAESSSTTTATSTTAAAGLTDEEYLTRGNAACETDNAAIDAIFSDLTGPPDQATFDALVAAVNQQIDDLAAVEPPPDLAEDHKALVEAARAAGDQMEAEGVAFFDDPTDPFEEANAMAVEMGLNACGGD